MCTDGGSYPAFSANMITDSAYSYCTYQVQLNTPLAVGSRAKCRCSRATPSSRAAMHIWQASEKGPRFRLFPPGGAVDCVRFRLERPKGGGGRSGRKHLRRRPCLEDHKEIPGRRHQPHLRQSLRNGVDWALRRCGGWVGNLYIGDSGKVIEIPFINGALANSKQVTIASGLGTGNLSLAVNGMGDVFVADQQKAQVVESPTHNQR